MIPDLFQNRLSQFLLVFKCSGLKSHLPIQPKTVYRREFYLCCKAPHFDIEIHDIVLFAVASPLLLQKMPVNAVYVGFDRPQFFDIYESTISGRCH